MRYQFFLRNGGVSTGRFESLNIAYDVGDHFENVSQNRSFIKNQLGVPILLSAHQVHGDRIFVAKKPIMEDTEVDGYDALITNHPGFGLMIQQADCQAVLLHDPHQQAIAAIHCGWRGSVAGIIGKTVRTMQQSLDTQPARLKAFIGPSLGPCCAEFINYKKELPKDFHRFQIKANYFDFWKISSQQLMDAGVLEKNITNERICTSCNELFFSYRRACRGGDGVTGRHCSVICLDKT